MAQKHGLSLILLFGSRIQGKIHKESDFDVAYLAEKELDLMAEARLILDLSSIFKSENIDLVNLRKAPPLLLFAITKTARIVFEKEPLLFAALGAYAFHKYIETKPFYEDKFRRLEEKLTKLKS